MQVKEEVERTIKQFVENMPEKIKQEVLDHLFVAFGIKNLKEMPNIKKKMLSVLPDGRRYGQRWSDIKMFYPQFQIQPQDRVTSHQQHDSNNAQSRP